MAQHQDKMEAKERESLVESHTVDVIHALDCLTGAEASAVLRAYMHYDSYAWHVASRGRQKPRTQSQNPLTLCHRHPFRIYLGPYYMVSNKTNKTAKWKFRY